MKRTPLALTTAPLLLAAATAFAAEDPFARIPLLHDGSTADCQQYNEIIHQLDQQASRYRQQKTDYERSHEDEMRAQIMAQQQQMMAQYSAAMASGDPSAMSKLARQHQQQAMGMSAGINAPMQCLADLESAYNHRMEAARTEVAQRLAPDTDKLLTAAKGCAQPSGSLSNVDGKCTAPARQSYKTALAAAAPVYVSGFNDAVTRYRSSANACLDKAYAAQRQSFESNPMLKAQLGGLAYQQSADRYETATKFVQRVQDDCAKVARLVEGPGDQPFGDNAPRIVYRSFTSQPVRQAPTQKSDLGDAAKKALGSLFGK